MSSGATDRILFITGRLAAPALRAVLERTPDLPPHDVAVLRITVAALMTTSWIGKRLEVPSGVGRIVLPGLVQGETDELQDALGIPVEKGPVDLLDLPRWLGLAEDRPELGPRDVRVFAEINDVPKLTLGQVLDRADRYRDDGADVIDLGLSLDRSWLEEGPAVIAALRERGLAVSIDTLDPAHIRMADEAGVDYVLSLNVANLDLADDLRATPILIPHDTRDLDSLDRAIAHLRALGKPFLVDPILEPITSGFAESLGRYLDVRRRHPDVEMLMGIGNLTELTEADSTGITALLIGFCQELRIGAVLTTAVVGWAQGAVREAVVAAQIMFLAEQQSRPPKHIDGSLVTARDEHRRERSDDELRRLQAEVRDPNWRLYVEGEDLIAFNGHQYLRERDMYVLFDRMEVDDPTHAFYLGKELMKAEIARGLGKSYRQEGPLDWGYLSFPEPRRRDGRPRRRRGHPRNPETAGPGSRSDRAVTARPAPPSAPDQETSP